MQRRKSARNQKPEPTPAQESPAPAKDTAKGKRKDTPVKEKQADTPPAPPPPPPLPTKLATGQPIPTVKEPQPASLPESDWQSVIESNVLKAALERSRQKWMTPGIFELYYSKAGKKKLPNKGKNKEEDKDKEKDKNKTKEGGGDGAKEKEPSETLKAKQMKREGNCKLYIDPHQWDITLWTMRENTPPPPPPQPTYRALCIDFNTNGDRLLFPRETILEALPGNQVLASFLKVHKVDQATLSQLPKTQTYYSPGKEYYQPITVRFRATSPADSHSTGVLQCLFRWVRPQDEVRKFMEEVMDRAEPAEDVELAARLPREGFVQEGTSNVDP
ncbi:hypothetical protein UCDDS831_g05714 [Diplodia seriata]|uniref:SWR1-complex protein 3 domain-containing protein n=1 Tax=Diplodia seriata TaxID=420778 RepID=A0A0G2E7T5_9PEZI|nr:hypothetical protein UCDDS831_g05714 [Diplodia seriata]